MKRKTPFERAVGRHFAMTRKWPLFVSDTRCPRGVIYFLDTDCIDVELHKLIRNGPKKPIRALHPVTITKVGKGKGKRKR